MGEGMEEVREAGGPWTVTSGVPQEGGEWKGAGREVWRWLVLVKWRQMTDWKTNEEKMEKIV